MCGIGHHSVKPKSNQGNNKGMKKGGPKRLNEGVQGFSGVDVSFKVLPCRLTPKVYNTVRH